MDATSNDGGLTIVNGPMLSTGNANSRRPWRPTWRRGLPDTSANWKQTPSTASEPVSSPLPCGPDCRGEPDLQEPALWEDCRRLNRWDPNRDETFGGYLDSWCAELLGDGLGVRTPDVVRGLLIPGNG